MNAWPGLVFAATFVLMALGRFGRLPLPRGPVALAGGLLTALLLRLGWHVVDLDVIALLAGLMVLAGLGEATGMFDGVEAVLARRGPHGALRLALAVMGVTSALLLNDAAVVVLLPVLLPVLRRHGLHGGLTVVLLALAANVGSLATPFGNPQNAVLASAAGLGVADFLRQQALWVVVAGAVLMLAAGWVPLESETVRAPQRVRLGVGPGPARAAVAAFLLLAATRSWTGVPYGAAALAAAVALYVWLRVRTGPRADAAAGRALDGNVVMLFVGLYFLTAGIPGWLPAGRVPLGALASPWPAAGLTVGLSNLVGNVPAVLTFQALDPDWTVAHAPFLVTVSTLGGSLLLTGSAASLLAADGARRQGVEVGFGLFARAAVPLMAGVLLAASWWQW